ncbi:PhoH family protein [Porphyromonas circumdentaria]|uniref:PhoH family protein n=1 Tax=Porphyromonas circumdentaria TaxID=29524 RepID=UPI00099A3281|nr:PhoH family protein [Porphyromonas circumdentaria]MBB6276353.1 phosphate starvation-inducible PhoH-like protein [Porphyromonas circumdentaria]MDO4722358.1 PhoH family protein [Porphyromonas circumdentaria]
MTERIYIPEDVDLGVFYGVNREHLILLRTLFPKIRLLVADGALKILGEASAIDQFVLVLDALVAHTQKYNQLNEEAIRRIARGEDASTPEPAYHILYGTKGKSIAARGKNQQRMVEAFNTKDMIFAVGPAGTGKTFIAISLAVKALKERRIRRIILSRPAVEAGEKLGFLPGEMKDKLDPYLQPLYDALEEMIPQPRLKDYIELGTIQIAPLAYMRGRTLNDAVIILDEAQNTTVHQMKMFLTRMGYYSKMIITGDVTQIDLPYGVRSGLKHAQQVLGGINSIAHIEFEQGDIVRHPLVQQIVEAYDKDDIRRAEERKERTKEENINTINEGAL